MTETIINGYLKHCSESLVPAQATLELTWRCNERCGHCYLPSHQDTDKSRKPLRGPQWLSILDELQEAGTLFLVLIGGEAMMHPDFWTVAEGASQRGFATTLITNGLLLDEASADRLRSLGIQGVTLSIYSSTPEIHDAMTGVPGSWRRTTAALQRMRDRGIAVGVNCLLTRLNIGGWRDMLHWCEERGVQVRFDPLVTARSDGDVITAELRPTHAQLQTYFAAVGVPRAQVPQARVPWARVPEASEDPVCNAGRGKCAVTAYGDLLTCLEVRTPLGNLMDRGFSTLWHSPQAQAMRGLRMKDLEFDTTCGTGAHCDHCPGMARAESGDERRPVPYLMEIASIKEALSWGS